ncbi:CocE/NonD family hydrolase [Glacieibacterium frigidum]|uniref:CocE/NonD family hydrolase n=2 Tax=Glacieibacterium frigidum TaxID=2593303 RepID=A0A552UJB1_9SPHN|nr:CocE/NonD family hydrolase [Glacieibacterium frigidum]
MRIYWDVPIEMDDGLVLRADLFLPVEEGRYPVILSMGAYGKGLAMQEGFPSAWNIMIEKFPEVAAGSTNKYQNWEVVDPEKWVPDGYACLRIDSRGSGRSPGYFDSQSAREIRDLYDCIEWAAVQDWSSGKVGMNGISYFAQNQWYVAKHQPPSLAAICVWEGFADLYRECCYTAGILNEMVANTVEMQMNTVQYGRGVNGPRSAVTGQLVCGDVTLSEEELARNRFPIRKLIAEHPFADEWYAERSADFAKTIVPLLTAGNWGGQPLHTRGNVEGFVRAASSQKWLEMHGYEHWVSFYTDYGIDLQKRFFGHFLKGEPTGWLKQPRVQLQIRHPGDTFVQRMEQEWPLARTNWTKFYLHADGGLVVDEPDSGAPKRLAFEALGKGLHFTTPPLAAPMEITGPSAAKFRISSSTENADLFLVLRVFDPAGKEVLFRGALDPKTPVAQGWLRASRRKLVPELSEVYRPYHAHDEDELLTPDVPVDLDIEIWPTSIVVPAGHRLALSILGRDFEHDEAPSGLSNMKFAMKGCGPFTHNDPADRPVDVFGGTTTLHFDDGARPYVLLPVIPAAAGA